MLKKDGWQKKFLRVKQMADQNLGRAEKSEVLSEDLLVLEKRVDLIKQVCHNTQKTLSACLLGKGTDIEKRMKKMPQSMLAHSMIESGQLLGTDTLMGKMFQLCGESQGAVAADLLQCEMDIENKVLAPLLTIDNEITGIHKSRKQLTKTVLDMDSARARYHSAVKQSQHGTGTAKVENIRDEMEEASQRVEQSRDQISTDIYTFVSKEAEQCQLLMDMVVTQAAYHKKTLEVLEGLLPQLQEQMELASVAPLYGNSLEDHLKRMNRDISVVLEECICTLLVYGMSEEGLFRIAGSASKVKKLKAAFDSGMIDMREFDNDIHTVAGALKLYLRELPEPLMTYDLYQDWMQAASLPVDQRLQALWVVLDRLPQINYNNLRYLIKFLAKLAENQDVNKMSPSNIAIVMGPNLMWAPGDGGPSMLSTSMQSAIVESLISHADWFFPGDIDFGVTQGSISPAHSGSNGSLLDSNQNIQVNHDTVSQQTTQTAAAVAGILGPAMLIHSAVPNASVGAPNLCGGQTTPPSSMTASTNSLHSPDDRATGQPTSPKLSKRITKKAPAPLPPGVPERPPIPTDKIQVDAPYVSVSPTSVDTSKPPIPDRPQAALAAAPTQGEKLYPSLPNVSEQKPEKPEKPEKPSSPRPDRPKAPPPERPQFPPPEKPEKPPLPTTMEKPQLPNRPDLPATGGTGTLRREGQGSVRPPRPQPPPPPPPDRRSSQETKDNKAPIAEQEPVSPLDSNKNPSDVSTYL